VTAVAVDRLTPGDPAEVGGFELHGRLGAGGMGRVYLGLSASGRVVAVKVIHPELAQDGEFRARFRQEVAAAQAVSGAFTAPVVAAGPDDDPPWLATAFVPGPSLTEAVARAGPFPVASTWRLAAGLAEALAAVHSAGLVHRDLKPSNVLLAADGPRVIDFGISRAREATSVTMTGMTVGTPGFMSPEQAEGGPVQPASDIFSLGCVLAFAASGRSPFGDGTPPQVLYRVVHAAPVLDDVPGPLRDLVTGCLAKAPADRPSLRRVAEELKARTPPDAVTSLSSYWEEPLATLVQSYQASTDAGSQTGGARAATQGAAGQPRTQTVAADFPGRSGRSAGSGGSAGAGGRPVGSGGPSAAPASRPPGITRRQVVGSGVAGLLAFGAGVTAWALTRGGHSQQGSHPPPGRSVTGTSSQAARRPGAKLWSFQTSGGQVHSVAVGGGTVYLANTNNGAAPDAHDVYALNAATGGQIWRVTNLGELYSLLTLADGSLYFGTDFHYVYALNAANGKLRWRYRTGDRTLSQPAVLDGVVFTGSNDGSLYALDASAGHRIWSFRTGGAIRSGPVVKAFGLVGAVTFGSDDGGVYRLDAGSGTKVWHYATGGPVRESVAVGPGQVYAASDDQHVYGLLADTGVPVWRFPVSGHPVSPVLSGDILYVGSTANTLYALHATTGDKIWTFPAAGDQITWRPAVADGVVYAGSLDGHVYALNAADGSKLWSFATGGPVNSALQVSGGVLYAGSDDGRLYALALRG
jgi:outer membrane protein assembly factor BamB